MSEPTTTPSPATQPGDPLAAGLSTRYNGGRPLRRYITFYALAGLGITLLWGGVLSILLPLHIQELEVARFFTGADAGVDLAQLNALKIAVEAGTALPSADEQRQLAILATYESSKASSLSLVESIGIIVTLLTQPLIGLFSDRTRSRWGRRVPWIVGGTVTGAGLMLAMRFSPSIGLLVVLWSVVQLAVNCAQSPLNATVADRVPSEKVGTVSAITGLCAYLGTIVGMMGAGSLFAAVGLDAYIPFMVPLVLFAVLFAALAPDRSSKELAVDRITFKDVITSYGAALRYRDYRWAWIAKVVLWIGYGISTMYSLYMLQSYIRPVLNVTEAATTAPLIQLAAIPGTLVAMAIAGSWSDRSGRRKPFVIAGSLLMAVSFLVPFLWPALPAMVIQAVIAGLGFGTYLVVDQALFIDVLPDKTNAAGRDLGMSALGQNLGQAIGPVIAGAVVAAAGGGYGPVWLVACVIVLVAALAIVPIKAVR